MIGFDKQFNLKITISDEQKNSVIEEFATMNKRLSDMVTYIEKAETTKAEKEKYVPLYMNSIRAIAQSFNILKAMDIPESEIKKHCKF